ncbi:glycosyltransferase family 2 protein [Methanobrevibacter sp. YE315]|uniref:glycosyltransferase family 2 protein n=1 Tax=Methanobrevibacter sp. YE315 TaxID=1609968 RepID=UPI000835B5AF|nr:glycosyltransferase family 2 protein [Methanobrevibacter sp. YE315]
MYYLTMIIPVFNSDDCISDAINSVINQTIGFENIELIVVDDCSTDNTRDVINDYEKRYPNVKGIFLDKNNGGAGIPRNIGIKNASSKYLMFMDADDEYEKDACEVFYNKIVETNADFVYSNWTWVAGDKTSKTSHQCLSETQEFTFENGENIKEYYKYYRGGMCAAIYNKEFVISNDIKCHKELGEDGYFSLNSFFHAKKVVFLDYFGYYNKLRESDEKPSITNVRDEKMFWSRVRSIHLFNDLLEEYGAHNKQFLLKREIKVILYQVYMIRPGVTNKKRKEFFKVINNLEKEFNINKFNNFIFDFLNYFVINEHYTVAILMSRTLGYMFSKPKIRKILRKINM